MWSFKKDCAWVKPPIVVCARRNINLKESLQLWSWTSVSASALSP